MATEPLSKRVFEIFGVTHILPDFIHTYFSSREVLLKEKKSLEEEVALLENKLEEQKLLFRERLMLYEGDASTTPYTTFPIVSSSLAQDVTKLYATTIFSKGYSDGVEEGALVFLRGRQVVCTIKEVYARTSLCELYSGYGNKVEGVTSSSSINVILEGRGGHYIANIVRDTKIEKGEKVLLRTNQTFVLGEVTEVFNNDQDTSWHILVKGGYNPVSSSLFYIEKKGE